MNASATSDRDITAPMEPLAQTFFLMAACCLVKGRMYEVKLTSLLSSISPSAVCGVSRYKGEKNSYGRQWSMALIYTVHILPQ